MCECLAQTPCWALETRRGKSQPGRSRISLVAGSKCDVTQSRMFSIRSLPASSVKGQIANIFSLTSHVVFVTTTQFHHCNVKAATDNPQEN